MISTNWLPKEPVPPVTSTEASLQVSVPSLWLAFTPCSPCRLLPDWLEDGQEVEVELADVPVEVAGVTEHHLEVLFQQGRLDQVLAGARELRPAGGEVCGKRHRASRAPPEQPPDALAGRHRSARPLDVGPRRRAIHVSEERLELARELRQELRVQVRRPERRRPAAV